MMQLGETRELIENIVTSEDLSSITILIKEEYRRFHFVCDFDIDGTSAVFVNPNNDAASAWALPIIDNWFAGNRTLDEIIDVNDEGYLYAYGTQSKMGEEPTEFTKNPNFTKAPLTQLQIRTNTSPVKILAGGKFTLYGQK